MLTSQVPAIKAALHELITAELVGVQVSYGHPGRNMAREMVFIGDVSISQEFKALGGRTKHETFELDLIISVVKPGAQQRVATERAFELLATIEELLRANLTLDGLVAWLNVRPEQLTEGFSEDGREAEIASLISGLARI
jgi:hypothetical protein